MGDNETLGCLGAVLLAAVYWGVVIGALVALGAIALLGLLVLAIPFCYGVFIGVQEARQEGRKRKAEKSNPKV